MLDKEDGKLCMGRLSIGGRIMTICPKSLIPFLESADYQGYVATLEMGQWVYVGPTGWMKRVLEVVGSKSD